ncbi:MAG TPA: transcriptional regulator [Bacteroidales bacterium]|nr:transcriptional regulator [Bacteroidales bacterium]
MKDRIIQFLSENNLTSTKFADSIGVQRSSISHVLSGRNKPSFDFIEKMLLAYPDLNAQWLITGKGNMLKNQLTLFNTEDEIKFGDLTSRESNIQNPPGKEVNKINSEQDKEGFIDQKITIKEGLNGIERIVIFYTNGYFKEYKPE